MRKLTLEYIAGFFDGEGCVGIYSHLRRTQRMKVALPLITPQIIITQKNPYILDCIKETLESYSVRCKVRPSKNNTINRLVITGKPDIVTFCELLIPHTVGKTKELESIRDYCIRRLTVTNKKYTTIDFSFIETLKGLKVSI